MIRFRNRQYLLCLLILPAVIPGGIIPAAIAQESPTADLDRPIEKYESNLQKLQSGIEIRLGQLQIAGQREFNLLAEIERIDKKLAVQKVRLEVMEERLSSQKEIFAVKLRELEDARTNMEEVKKHLQVRLRAYYLMGKTGLLNVTFSTRTLPDLMLFNDSFRSLLAYDQNLLLIYREAISQLQEATREFEQESDQLNTFIAETHEQQKELDRTLGEKSELLKKVKTQKVLHEQALREMEKAEEELRSALAKLKEKRAYTLKGFILNKGGMPPPVSGTVIRKFGDRRGDDVAKGIFIDAADGAEIKAIFPGQVIYAGYRRGYGNTVIIDHGLDYSSVTARMEKISVKEGDRVDTGTIIGAAGDIATLFEKGIYFEIRRGTEPVDPLPWLTRQGLTIQETAAKDAHKEDAGAN